MPLILSCNAGFAQRIARFARLQYCHCPAFGLPSPKNNSIAGDRFIRMIYNEKHIVYMR